MEIEELINIILVNQGTNFNKENKKKIFEGKL